MSQRQIVKTLVENNNISEAKTILDTAIIEHDNYIISRNIENTGDTFTSVDNLSLHHGQDHLNSFIDSTGQQIHQKDATIDALNE